MPQEQSSERSDEVEMNRRCVLVRLQVQGSRAIVPSAPDSHGRVCQMRPFLLLQVILEQPYRPLPSDRKHVICKLLQRLRQDTRYSGVSTFIGLLQYVHRRPWPLPPHFTKQTQKSCNVQPKHKNPGSKPDVLMITLTPPLSPLARPCRFAFVGSGHFKQGGGSYRLNRCSISRFKYFCLLFETTLSRQRQPREVRCL